MVNKEGGFCMAQPAVETFTSFPELDAFIDGLKDRNGALIPVLHQAQEVYGYLPKEVQLHIARRLQVPAAKVYGVATFYSLFSLEKRGKYRINVCMGTPCYVKNAESVLKEFANELDIDVKATTEDGMFTVDAVRCVGACGLAPVVMINDDVFGNVKTADVKGIVKSYQE